MGKSFFDNTEEQRGSLPAMTGALLKIKGIERSKTGENAKTPGCRMYVLELEVVEPAEFAGTTVRDWITVGTAEDPLAKRPETWARSEGGPGRLKRLLTRSGTPLSDDDEEWMEAAEDREVVAPISARAGDDGQMRNRVGMFFRASDEDCPDIGLAEEGAGTAKGATKNKPRGAAAAAKSARGKTGAKGKESEDEDEEEAEEKPKAGKKGKPADDDDADEDEEEKPKKGKKTEPKKGKGKKDEDDDEDDDE